MKKTNKMTRSRMTRTASLLGVLLCAQNLTACYIVLPNVCIDISYTGTCSGEYPTTYVDQYSTGASLASYCEFGSTGGLGGVSGSSCDQSVTSKGCSYTLHTDYCDGSSSDVPETAGMILTSLKGKCS